MANPNDVKLGPCTVTYDGTDLGYTKGGVTFSVATETNPVTVDQEGDTPLSEVITQRQVTVDVPMAETTLANLVAIMPGATLVGTAGNPQRVDVVSGVGTDLRTLAKPLILHPLSSDSLPAADVAKFDVHVHEAGVGGNIEFAYESNEVRVYAVTFTGFPRTADGVLFSMGDPSAT